MSANEEPCPVVAPTCDGIWIPVLNGVPCEPVQIRHLHVKRGVAHYDVMVFGWDIPNSDVTYKQHEWLKYVPPIVAKK